MRGGGKVSFFFYFDARQEWGKRERRKKKTKTEKTLTHASAGASRAHALLDRVLAVLVVDAALLRVAEDVVGLVDVFEGVGVATCLFFFFQISSVSRLSVFGVRGAGIVKKTVSSAF